MAELIKLPFTMNYTNVSAYLNCPKKFYHQYVVRDAAATRTWQKDQGISAHDALRKRLRLREKLPEQHARFEGLCLDIERLDVDRHVEIKLGIDAAGRACDFGAPVVRFNCVADLLLIDRKNVAYLLDWKSGKPWEDPLELRLQALVVKARFPHVRRVTGSYYWLRVPQAGPVHPVVDDTSRTWNDLLSWNDSIARRLDNNDWPADENPLCGWCPCSKQQCEFRKDPK